MSKTVPHEVDLTQADIDGGCRSKASNCPGALAINRVVAPLGLYSSVGGYSTDFYDEPVPLGGFEDGRPPVATINNPAMLRTFVAQFDGGSEVSPFKFTIELPADLRFHKLTLTGKEADTLRVLLASVGGNPSTSPRGHMSSLSAKLQAAGVRYWGDIPENELKSGSFMFSPYEDAADHPNQPW